MTRSLVRETLGGVLALAFYVALGALCVAVASAMGPRASVWVPLALADSVNPCELAIQATFGVSLAVSLGPLRAFGLLFAYSLGVVLSYLLLGLGLSVAAARVPPWLAGSVAVVIGCYQAIATLRSRGECPECVERARKGLARMTSGYLGAFAVGSLLGLTVSPCTAGPYLAFLSIVGGLPLLEKVLSLFAYSFVFGIPLYAITLLFLLVGEDRRVQLHLVRNYGRVRLIASLLVIAVGFYVLYLFS